MNATASQHTPLDAEQILKAAQAGDQHSFALLVGMHKGMVYGLAYHMFRDAVQAEDMAQEVFLELYRSLGQIQSSSHLKHWLRKVASHRCIDQSRRVFRFPFLRSAGDEKPQAVVAGFRDPLLGEAVRQQLATLPARQRLMVTLRFQEDLQPAEIGELMGLPVNTVKSHLQRALSSLRAGLGRQLGEIDDG